MGYFNIKFSIICRLFLVGVEYYNCLNFDLTPSQLYFWHFTYYTCATPTAVPLDCYNFHSEMKRGASTSIDALDALDTLSRQPSNELPFQTQRKKGRKGRGNIQPPTELTTDMDDVADIHSEPLSCVICNETGCSTTTISCECCDQSYHLSCYGVEEVDHKVVSNLISVIGWTCKLCRDDTNNELKQLKKELLTLTNRLDQITQPSSQTSSAIAPHQQVSPVQGAQPLTNTQPNAPTEQLDYASVVTLVRKSVKDVNMRQRNVIVSGLLERDGGDDAGLFCRLCEVELGIKPLIQRDGTRRLGKNIGVGPRKLLVRLSSETTALELIQLSRKLRNSKDPNVASKIFINPDLTKDEAKQAFQRRESRRQSRSVVTEQNNGGIQLSANQGSIAARSSRKAPSSSSSSNTASGVNSSCSLVNVNNVTAPGDNLTLQAGLPLNSIPIIATTMLAAPLLNCNADIFSPSTSYSIPNPIHIDTPSASVVQAGNSVAKAGNGGQSTGGMVQSVQSINVQSAACSVQAAGSSSLGLQSV